MAEKVDELTTANAALAEARASLVRSEKLATVGRLAAGVAHEVGNPLGAIAGYAELARARLGPDADPSVRDSLDRIAAAADRIDRIVRDLLDFARPARLEVRAVSVASFSDRASDARASASDAFAVVSSATFPASRARSSPRAAAVRSKASAA